MSEGDEAWADTQVKAGVVSAGLRGALPQAGETTLAADSAVRANRDPVRLRGHGRPGEEACQPGGAGPQVSCGVAERTARGGV